MGLLDRILSHSGRPRGRFGRSILRRMNSGHSGLWSWGLDLVDITHGMDILDIGCGGGRTVGRLASLATEGRVVGVDYSPDAVAVATKENRALIEQGRVEILEEGVSSMSFGDGAFDLVTAFETHYFWPDLAEDLKEVRRVTKEGGRFLIVGALYKDGKHDRRNQRIVDAGGMTYLSLEELRGVLESAGFLALEVREDADKGWFAVRCGNDGRALIGRPVHEGTV